MMTGMHSQEPRQLAKSKNERSFGCGTLTLAFLVLQKSQASLVSGNLRLGGCFRTEPGDPGSASADLSGAGLSSGRAIER